jgi:hypothetical protein
MSGAQAAAADLARVRQTEVSAEAPDEAMMESVRGVFGACETYFKACRMYVEGHPTRDRFLIALDEKMRAHVTRYDALDAEVTARGIAVEGEGVYEVDRADQNLWYPLYRDGIRGLTFEPEVGKDELVAFFKALVALAAMKPDDDSDDGEDDAVTILWDLDLANIGYAAIDTFVGGVAGEAAAAQRLDKIRDIVTVGMMKELVPANITNERLARDVDVARRLKSIVLSKTDMTFLAQENLGALAEVPERMGDRRDAMYVLAGNERAEAAEQMAVDPELLDKFIEALVRALSTEGGSSDVELLCLRIEQFFTSTVVGEQFARASAIRRHACVVLENRGGAPARPELVARVDVAMSADAALAAIISALAKRPDDQLAELYALVECLPKRAATALLRSLEQVEERKRRRAVCDVIATWGGGALDAATAVLKTSGEEYALDILYLIRKIGSERGIALLEEACRHGSAQVRGQAVRLFAEVAPRDAAARRAKTALRDLDSTVRAFALDAIVALAPAGSEAWIRESIQAEGFGKLDIAEKTRLFLAYARLGGEHVAPELVEKLNQRNLMMSARIDEERAAAAKALAQLRYEPARAAIEKLAKAKMARSGLNEACEEALAMYDRPSEPTRARRPSDMAISFKPKGPPRG